VTGRLKWNIANNDFKNGVSPQGLDEVPKLSPEDEATQAEAFCEEGKRVDAEYAKD